MFIVLYKAQSDFREREKKNERKNIDLTVPLESTAVVLFRAFRGLS